MKKSALFTACLISVAAIAGAANAADGCGRGYHRNIHGHCRANGVVVAPGLVIGNWYPNQGYWDGQRYWQHREHDEHGGWRYR